MNRKATLLGFAISIFYGQSSLAQNNATQSQIEEIVVSATKRDTNLSETPIPISALTSDSLDKMGAAGFEDYFNAVPSLSVIDIGPGQKRYALRGLQGPGEAQVGLYYDEIPVTGPPGESLDSGKQQPDIKLWDVERIEVLRGPQGTLYGNGSMGGTIRVISKRANVTETEYAASSLLSSTSGGGMNYEIRGLANIPLIEDKLAVRFSGYHVDYDGFIDSDRLGLTDMNTEETSGGRASLQWDINDVSSLSAVAYYQTMSTGGPFEINRAIMTSDSELESDRFIPQPYEDDIKMYNLTYEHGLDWADLVVSLSQYDRDTIDQKDTSPITGAAVAGGFGEPPECSIRTLAFCSQAYQDQIATLIPAGITQTGAVDSTSFEARLVSDADSALRWTAGLFYQTRESKFLNRFGRRDPNDAGTITTLLFSRENTRQTDQTAIFGEIEYDLTERLTMIAGLRWSEYDIDEQQWTLYSNFPPFGPPVLTPEFRGLKQSSENNVVPKLSFSYSLSDDAMAYVLYSEGFRTGGPNQPGGNQDAPDFLADSSKNYEVGLKTTWLDGAATLNASFFRIEWDDMQVVVDDITGSFDFITNFGEAAINGFELDGTYLLGTSGWFLSGQLALNDSGLVGEQPSSIMIDVGGVPTEVTVSDPGTEGDPIPNVPEWNAWLALNYDRGLENGWDLYSYVDWLYTDSARTAFSELSPSFAVRNSYTTANFRLGMVKDGLELAVFVKNVFDDITDQGVNVAEGDVPFTITTRPRTIGVEATWHF